MTALVALKLLERAGDGPRAHYSNTPESAMFLDRQSPGYIGGILEMANARLYRFWADLTEALKTGAPQNETKNSGEPMFAKLLFWLFVGPMTGTEGFGFVKANSDSPFYFSELPALHFFSKPASLAWRTRRGSNLQPPDSKSGVLSIELRVSLG